MNGPGRRYDGGGRPGTRHSEGHRADRTRPRPDLRLEQCPPRGHRHIRDLTLKSAPHQPSALRAGHLAGPRASRRCTVHPPVRRRQRGEVRTAGRPVPDHDGLSQSEDEAEDYTEHGDRPDTPYGRGAPV